MSKNLVRLVGGYSNPVKELGQKGFKVVGKTLVRKGKVYSMPRSVERAINSYKAGTRGYAGAFNFLLKEVQSKAPKTPPKALKEFFTNETRTFGSQVFKGKSGDLWAVYAPRSTGGGSKPTSLPKRDVKVTASQKPFRPTPKKATYVLTDNVVSFYHNGISHQTSRSNPMFAETIKALNEGNLEKAVGLVNIANAIEIASKGVIQNDGGVLKHNNQDIHETAQDWIINNMGKGENVIQPVINFLGKVKANKHPESVEGLWRFIRACGLIITPTGHFIGYKYVDDDFMDKHTGTIHYGLGKIVQMPRDMVEFNPEVACGPGIHVGAMNYVRGNSTILELLVDPIDVVSTPVDHNNEKLRCCKAQVWRILKHKNQDINEPTRQEEFFDLN